jgi:CubicO group peptidase (beta-lactamase class C family)
MTKCSLNHQPFWFNVGEYYIIIKMIRIVLCKLHPKILFMAKIKFLKTLVLLLIFHTIKAQSYVGFKTDIENYAQSLGLPTLVVAVAKADSLIFFKGIGSTKTDTPMPITPDDIFAIASVTKTFTSVLLQQLEAEGRILLTDPIDKYPNKYFTKDRWTINTTIAHIVSHTSESRPPGTNFVYNGSKYNIIFNAFASINPPVDNESITRPFTKELERRILYPLKMTHTLVRNNVAEDTLLKYVVTPYDYNDSAKKYIATPVDLHNIECGPGYGMMSSVKDMIKYSHALDDEILISRQRFIKISSPFYTNSPYGEGWFTFNFEGTEIAWAYGYGNKDAAILLKVPSRKLTFILLSSCSMPSATTRLGYGNPLNSPIVCSFIRNFVLNQSVPFKLKSDVKSIENEIQKNLRGNKSRISIEETFANATVSLFSPTVSLSDKGKSIQLLKFLINTYPKDTIWQSPTAFELIASLNDDYILSFASGISKSFYKMQNLQPAKLFFAGVINEKLGNIQYAIQLSQILAEGDAYNEQGYKFDALMKLAKYFEKSNPKMSKYYLGNLIKYKENIETKDDQYNEAKMMNSRL